MISLAIALQLATLSSPDSLAFDMQCVSTASLVANSNSEQRQALMPISTFFLGRAEGRGSSEAQILAAGKLVDVDLTGDDVRTVLTTCQGVMQDAGKRFQDIARKAAAQADAGASAQPREQVGPPAGR